MKTRTKNKKQIPILQRNIPIKYIDYVSIFSFWLCVISSLSFLTESLFPINLLVFLVTVWIFTLTTVPRITGFILKKENKKISVWLFWSFIFILYAFLAGMLWWNNPFLLWFFLLWSLMLPVWLFLLAWGILSDTLEYFQKINFHEVIQTLKLKLWILFISFPFLLSTISKLIWKEKIEISLFITSFILLSLILGWKYVKKYIFYSFQIIQEYLNEKRVRLLRLSQEEKKYYLNVGEIGGLNLIQSNKYIYREKLKRWYIQEILLGYIKTLLLLFIIWFLFEFVVTIEEETNWFFLSLWVGGFTSIIIIIVMILDWPRKYKSLLKELQNSLCLTPDANRFSRVNKNTIYFLKK